MNTSVDFDNCDDEIGPDNFMKRALEDAIDNKRAISLGEYNAFMNSIGAMVPGFIVKSLPRLLFSDLRDCIKCTRHAIEFIRNHPRYVLLFEINVLVSLPVSFNVKRGVQILFDYLQRQETFLKLEMEFSSDSFLTLARDLAKQGKIAALKVVLSRHFSLIKSELDKESIVSAVLVHIPIMGVNLPIFRSLLEEQIVPNLFELSELTTLCMAWARDEFSDTHEALELLALMTKIDDTEEILMTPLNVIRQLVLGSERGEILEKIRELKFCLETKYLLESSFSELNGQYVLNDLFEGSALLSHLAGKLLMDEGLERFRLFCVEMKITQKTRNDLLLERVVTLSLPNCEEQISKKFRPNENAAALVAAMDDTGSQALAVYRILLSQNGNSDWEEVATRILKEPVPNCDGIDLLRTHMLVISVQRQLCVFPDFAYLAERPDFFMTRTNVELAVFQLCTSGRVEVAVNLAEFFPYIDVEECLLLCISNDPQWAALVDKHVPEDRRAEFMCSVSALVLGGNQYLQLLDEETLAKLGVLEDFQKRNFSFWDLQDYFGPVYDPNEYYVSGYNPGDTRFARLRLVLGVEEEEKTSTEIGEIVWQRATRAELDTFEEKLFNKLINEETNNLSVFLTKSVFPFLAASVTLEAEEASPSPIWTLAHIGEINVGELTDFEQIFEYYSMEKLVDRFDWLGDFDVCVQNVSPMQSFAAQSVEEVRSYWACRLWELGIVVSKEFLQMEPRKVFKSSILPELIRKSGYDLPLAITFAEAIQSNSEERVKIQWLEQIFLENVHFDQNAVLSVLKTLEWKQVQQFLLPRLTRNEQLEIVLRSFEPARKMHTVILGLLKLEQLGSGPVSLVGIEKTMQEILLCHTSSEIVKQSILIGRDLQLPLVGMIRKLFMSPQSLCVKELMDGLDEEREAVIRSVLTERPASRQRDLVNWLTQGVSEKDLRLLDNRIILEKSNLIEGFLERRGDLDSAVNWAMEQLVSEENDVLLEALAEANRIELSDFRVNLVRKLLTEDCSSNRICAILAKTSPSQTALVLLQAIFKNECSLVNKCAALEALFRLVPKQVIMKTYANPIENLIQIQKVFLFIVLLEQNLKVKHHLNYKEFAQQGKESLVKNLLQGSKLETLKICAMIVIDYDVFDYDLIHTLEAKLKAAGSGGTQIAQQVKNQLLKSGIYFKIAKPTVCTDAKFTNELPNDENMIHN